MIGDGPGVKAPRSGAIASVVARFLARGACASLLPLVFFSLFLIAKVAEKYSLVRYFPYSICKSFPFFDQLG